MRHLQKHLNNAHTYKPACVKEKSSMYSW